MSHSTKSVDPVLPQSGSLGEFAGAWGNLRNQTPISETPVPHVLAVFSPFSSDNSQLFPLLA